MSSPDRKPPSAIQALIVRAAEHNARWLKERHDEDEREKAEMRGRPIDERIDWVKAQLPELKRELETTEVPDAVSTALVALRKLRHAVARATNPPRKKIRATENPWLVLLTEAEPAISSAAWTRICHPASALSLDCQGTHELQSPRSAASSVDQAIAELIEHHGLHARSGSGRLEDEYTARAVRLCEWAGIRPAEMAPLGFDVYSEFSPKAEITDRLASRVRYGRRRQKL